MFEKVVLYKANLYILWRRSRGRLVVIIHEFVECMKLYRPPSRPLFRPCSPLRHLHALPLASHPCLQRRQLLFPLRLLCLHLHLHLPRNPRNSPSSVLAVNQRLSQHSHPLHHQPAFHLKHRPQHQRLDLQVVQPLDLRKFQPASQLACPRLSQAIRQQQHLQASRAQLRALCQAHFPARSLRPNPVHNRPIILLVNHLAALQPCPV